MGTNTSGGMIIGAEGSDICTPEYCDEDMSLTEFSEFVEMVKLSPNYDADESECFFGYPVPDVAVSEMDGEWMQDIRCKAIAFTTLFGVEPKLIGMQDIT